LVKEWTEAALSQRGQVSVPNVGQWKPPGAETIKINIDGSIDAHNHGAGGGMVARDGDGMVLGAMAISFPGLHDPFIVESKALLCAIEWTTQRGWNNICFESDCSILITEMSNGH